MKVMVDGLSTSLQRDDSCHVHTARPMKCASVMGTRPLRPESVSWLMEHPDSAPAA